MMFLDLNFEKRIQSAVNLGHRCVLSGTLIAQGASSVLLFRTNRLLDQARALATGKRWSRNGSDRTNSIQNQEVDAVINVKYSWPWPRLAD
jgi:hypothetical protein